MEKLFKLFGKLEESPGQPTLNVDGIGLGLTICQKIVENCGGKIECYSSGEGQGSVFMFSMEMTMPESKSNQLSYDQVTSTKEESRNLDGSTGE